MFHLHDTLPQSSSSTHWVAHLNAHKAAPNQLMCSYYLTVGNSYYSLASQDITQYTMQQPHITHSYLSTNLLQIAVHFVPVVMWHFSLARLMPCSSSWLATDILMPCSTTCWYSLTYHVRTVKAHGCWLAIPRF